MGIYLSLIHISDVMVSGGAEASITPIGIAGFTSLTALNTTEDASRASIPFDEDRNGFVMGEGAGVVEMCIRDRCNPDRSPLPASQVLLWHGQIHPGWTSHR